MNDLANLPSHELSKRGARLHRVFTSAQASLLLAGHGSESPAALAILQREYGFRAALHPAWAVMPQALVTVDDGVVLQLHDPGGRPLRGLTGQPLGVATFLEVASAITSAVADMHAADVVHRSLTPDCVLFDDTAGTAAITGFGCAARLGDAAVSGDDLLAWDDGCLDYMAPELGLRISDRIDARVDLYSLGCIFHELLSGAPPFQGQNAAALIHAHATQLPAAVPAIPAPLASMLARLLEKAPDQRYADARGLLADLRNCQGLLARHGAINDFALDAGARLVKPDDAVELLGRQRELEQLAQRFEQAAAGGGVQRGWVWGEAGIGKSMLLREAVRRIGASQAALIASGKCDATRSDLPFDGLVQAAEPLLQRLLGTPKEEFEAWQARLQRATEPVAPTLCALLPGLKAVLGLPHDMAAPALADTALLFERELVLHAMARLLACFARPERPLVLLIDDMQWADVDTLRVLERLLADHARAPVLLLGSVRADGPSDRHPLCASPLFRGDDALQVVLRPLEPGATQALVAQVLRQPSAQLEALSAWVDRWTDGNPFFIRRLLAQLVAEGALTYSADQRCWTWDQQAAFTHPAVHGVSALLSRELTQLPATTLALLQRLACLGDRAALPVLASAGAVDELAVRDALAPAAAAGFVRLDAGQVRMTHDHIRDAAYASVPHEQRASLHLQIAHNLSAQPDGEVPAFLVAAQANLGWSAAEAPAERRAFALLNAAAGRQAKAATSHHAARQFFGWALNWLGEEQASPEAMEVSLLCGEAEFATGALEAAEARLGALQVVAGDGLFGADVARLRTALYTALGRYDLALDVGLAFLGRSGIRIPRRPNDADVDAAYRRLRGWLDRHGVAGLHAIPADADPHRRTVVNIFADLIPPALYSNQNLLDLMLLEMVHLAIAHGHTDASANGYVCMIQVLGTRYGDYASARAFGELALHLVDERGLQRYSARVHHTYATFVVPFTAPARSARAHFAQAFDLATRTGDHTFALYCGRNQATGMLFAGELLEDIRQTVEAGLTRARDANFQLVVDALLAQKALLGRLQDGEYRGATMAEPQEGGSATLVDLAYWVYRLQLGLLFDDLPEALEARRRAEACQMAARSFAEFADLPFYGAIALLRLHERDASQEAALQRHLALLHIWTVQCPDNFAARRALVWAEQARAAGRASEAAELYAQAVAQARRHGLVQVEALAAELAARHFAGLDRDIERRAYLRHALGAWQRWGAAAKARQLQLLHPELLDADAPVTAANRLHALDVQAVLRVTHALASDLVPDRLVETTMRTALEAMGADHGVLLLLRGEDWVVRAQAHQAGGETLVSQHPAGASTELLPLSIAFAVARQQQAMQLDDAVEHATLGQDDYIQRNRPRSLLCAPMMRYARLVGVLYLENKRAPRVFTAAKAELLEVIASQAAFSLENTRLYEEVLDQGRQRAEAEERLRTALADLARASRLKEMGEMVASIVHEIGQPLSAIDTSAGAAVRWLRRDRPDIGEAVAVLSQVSLSAKRAKTIIQGLRALARKAEPQFGDVELGDALRECASLVAAPLQELHVTLTVHAPDQPCLLRGDRVQLQQVAINLLMNGAEAMVGVPAGQRQLSLAWRVDDGGLVTVEVEDRGTGITPDEAPRLLEPFFTTKRDGMGMGLAICKSIVDAHGGTLDFLPAAPTGTRVVLNLPMLALA